MLEHIEKIVESVQVSRFQWRLHFLNALIGLLGSSRTILDVIFSRQPNWRCEEWATLCEKRRESNKYFIPCQDYTILPGVVLQNRSEHDFFLVYFKLVCKDDHFDWNLPLASSFFFMGSLFGGCLLGILSDTKGRWLTVTISLVGALVSSIMTIFAPFIQYYVLHRFLDGFFFGGYSINTFIISIEYSIPEGRHGLIFSYFVMWGPAMLLMLLINNYFPTWQVVAGISASLVLLTLLCNLILGIESAAWALTSKEDKKAKTIITRLAKIIRMEVGSIPDVRFNRSQSSQSVHDLIRGSRFRKYRRSILLLLFIWFVTAISYYLSYYEAFFKQGSKKVEISSFTLIIISSACNFVGFCLAPILARYLNRRHSLILGLLATAISSFILIAKNKYSDFVVHLLSKTLTSALFALVYLVTVELAPTPSRGLVFGLCFGISRLGAMLAPHVAYIADVFDALPHLVVGTSLLLCCVAAWGLPETLNIPLLHDYYQLKEFLKTPDKYRARDLSRPFESSM